MTNYAYIQVTRYTLIRISRLRKNARQHVTIPQSSCQLIRFLAELKRQCLCHHKVRLHTPINNPQNKAHICKQRYNTANVVSYLIIAAEYWNDGNRMCNNREKSIRLYALNTRERFTRSVQLRSRHSLSTTRSIQLRQRHSTRSNNVNTE